MTDEDIRALVRDAIGRHLGGQAATRPAPAAAGPPPASAGTPEWRAHASFGKFLLLRDESDTSCLIEPSVQCTHCGFCQSYGH